MNENSQKMTWEELALENQKIKAENDRLKKMMSDLQSAEKTVDATSVVQQVQGLLSGYLKVRKDLADSEAQLATRNEDNRRLQKMVAELQKK